ncbi:MAG TPA: aldehyde dehydrogenase family protein [Amycolatopsis sp.]|nr:aldehyde dehydrogenase family protein [Amycolatopsis sp.]
MNDYAMTIDGRPAATSGTFDVLDPATGEVFAQAPDCTEAQLNAAMEAAERAWSEWRREGLSVRRAALLAAQRVLADHAGELAELLTREQGKPAREAAEEITDAQAWFAYYAAVEDPPQILQDDDSARVEIVRKPLGVVAAITPWNYPLTLTSWKLAPALLAGNTVVLKPSPYTPLATLRFGRLLSDALPRGVVNVVSGRDPLGSRMTAHPVPRKISFTGSVATGKLVAAAAAADLKRTTLELGGNDPAILLDDLDPAGVAEKLFWSAFENNGQVCSAVKRIYAPASRYDDVVESLAAYARSRVVGPGSAAGTDLGPLNNEPQFVRVRELVDDALAKGARAAAGGAALDRPGYFFAPTILADLDDGYRIVDEEQFGPVLPVVRYDDVDEVVRRVNASRYGLTGSVWSDDPDRADRVARELDAGTVFVNTHLALQPNQPFGGAKWSGIGVENGIAGLHGFSEPQVIHRAPSA